jgi:CHASE3 domain sensor protein
MLINMEALMSLMVETMTDAAPHAILNNQAKPFMKDITDFKDKMKSYIPEEIAVEVKVNEKRAIK